MKNIKKFILEKLKVTQKIQHLPTWEEFTDALYNFIDQEFNLSEYLEEFKDAEVKDYPTFINGGNVRYPEDGHIMKLRADADTPESQSIIIYFNHVLFLLDQIEFSYSNPYAVYAL